MQFELQLDNTTLSSYFPYYLMIDKNLQIIASGESLKKIQPDLENKAFEQFFKFKRPAHIEYSFESILSFQGQIYILECFTASNPVLMRYELKHLSDQNYILFIGSPWMTHTEDLKKYGLQLKDFALHDSMTDLLQILTVKDINSNEIKSLNLKLQESEVKFRTIVESASDMIYYADPDGYLTYVNQVILEKFGIDHDDIIGKNFTEFLPLEYQEEVYQFYIDKKEFKISQSYLEFPVKLPNGNLMWVGQNVSANQDENGEISSFISVARDITQRKEVENELKRTEARLSNLIKNLEAGILLENEKRQIVLTNSNFCEIFRIPMDPEALIGMDCSNSAEQSKNLFKDPADFVNRIDEILLKKAAVTREQLEMADGKYLERDFIPIYYKGQYMGHLWQYRDITEEKNYEKNLIRAHGEAERAQKAEEEFIARMSHEIRTPLNAVVGMTHLLNDTPLDTEQKEYVEILKSSAEILKQLISDILDISKISSGKLEVNKSNFGLYENMTHVLNSFKLRAPQKRLQLDLNFDEGIYNFVFTDKLLLNQILINLLSNAFKFTEKGHIKLGAKLIEEKDNIQQVEFSVSDTGIGISKINQEKIFKKFQQAEADINERFGGTGLGLYIVSQLVDLLKGSIHLESQEAKGSTFKVVLPLQKGKSVELKSPQITDADIHINGARILVAEDNLMNQTLISRMLKNWSFDFKVVSNGQEVMETLANEDFDLLLLDLQMPVMDGFETTKAIRSSADDRISNIAIIALTASALTDFKRESELVGIDDFVSKPFVPADLREKINNLSHIKEIKTEKNLSFNKALDTAYLKEAYGDDIEYAAEMFEIFLHETMPEFNQLRDIIVKRENEQARRIIHKIYPNFTMVGISSIGEELWNLKEQIKNETDQADFQPVIEEIAAKMKEYIPILESEIERLKTSKSASR